MPGTKLLRVGHFCHIWILYKPMTFYPAFYRTSERGKLQTSEIFRFKENPKPWNFINAKFDKFLKSSITNNFLIFLSEQNFNL